MDTNVLYYGDNLDILRNYIADDSIDLIYIDPPFNSNQAYNVIFAENNGSLSQAQIRAFEDIWYWAKETEETFSKIMEETPRNIAKCLESFRNFLGESNMMAYLTMMTIRLIELHRVLKPTGSFYLHCDPTASHYLKVVLDQVFGIKNFQNEIVWCYKERELSKKHWNRKHDVILFYMKDYGKHTFNWKEVAESYSEYTLRRKFKYKDDKGYYRLRYKDGRTDPKEEGEDTYRQYESIGVPPRDWWQIPILNQAAKERLGYPTQKPEALLERIIKASSNEGDVVLDAFCGCGTTVAVAQRLKRRWIGVDITHLAITVIKSRLQNAFGDGVKYRVIGEPQDLASAKALAEQDRGRHEFERWALGLVGAFPLIPGGKKGADAGIDGVIRFQDVDPHNPKKNITLEIIVQVKSGKASVKDIRDLWGVIEREKAIIGVLITLENPTPPMIVEAIKAGYYERWGQKYPKIQIRTIEALFQGKKIDSPQTLRNMGFKKAERIETSKEIQQELNLLDEPVEAS
ncbi:site-specific DNA-methyltransferase [Candidatus Poribacteria bacterium]|nr:site-specific DNA-methyltransferase [Candidatus Poribacteria bacterium]